MDKLMKIEQQLKDLKEQNKQLIESLERHLEEKQDLRKQLYKDKVSNEFPPKHLPNGQKKIKTSSKEDTFKELPHRAYQRL